MEFSAIHPRNIEPFKNILAFAQLRRLLTEDLPKFKETPFYFHHLKIDHRSGLYCRFKGCKARLIYMRNQSKVYELIDFNNVHNHSLVNKLSKLKFLPQKDSTGQLYISEEMKNNLVRYSRCLYINFYTLKPNWHILVFSGVKHDQSACIFGLCIFEVPEEPKIKQILMEMSQKISKTETIVLTSPDLKKLAVECFPKATPIFFQPMNCPRLKIRFNMAKIVAETTTELEWEADKRRMAMELSEDLTISQIKQYTHKYRHICLPFLPNTFVGLGIQLMHPLVIFHALQEKSFLFTKVEPFLKIFPSQIKVVHIDPDAKEWVKNLSSLFKQDSLYQISNAVEESAFRFLVRQQNRSMYCNFTIMRDESFQVKHDSWGKFLVKKKQGKYECECKLSMKTGLPCFHILKILLFNCESILDYISPYWIIRSNKKPKHPINERAQRIDRRNNNTSIISKRARRKNKSQMIKSFQEQQKEGDISEMLQEGQSDEQIS